MEAIDYLLRTKFYENCPKHGKAETCFCKDCLSDPFCENCLCGSEHRKHEVLQVFKASRKEVIRLNDVDKFWNVSDIQPFVINSKRVVYIHERKTKGYPECRICGGHKREEKYAFCSIQCQFGSLQIGGNMDLNLNMRFSSDDESAESSVVSSSTDDEATNIATNISHSRPVVKHRRKGQPLRAPLY